MNEAYFALAGVLLGSIVQWLIARSLIGAEKQRLQQQIAANWNHENYLAWQRRFQDAISELICATDPELQQTVTKEQVIPLVHRAQLCLNLQLPTHAKCNGALTALALATTGWHGPRDLQTLLALHNSVVESAKEALWLPGR